MALSESDTRAKLIDPALHACGWTEDLIRREETAGAIVIEDGKPRKKAKGRVDYATGHNKWAMNRAIFDVAKEYIKDGKVSEGILNRVEVAIRCYDPCLSCSTHALGQMPLEIIVYNADGGVHQVLRS